MKQTLIIIFAFITSSIFGQRIIDLNIELPYSLLEIEKPNVRGNIKKINQTVYNCKKRKGKIKDARTDRESLVEFQFSRDGSLIKYIDFNRHKGDTQTIDFYENDSIVEIVKNETRLFSKSTYIYSDNLLTKMKTQIGDNKSFSLFFYDSTETLNKWIYYDREGKPSQKVTHEYIPDSLIEYRKFYFPDTIQHRRTYKYVFDENDRLVYKYEFEGSFESRRKYEYDSLGNLICITKYNLSIPQESWIKYEYIFDNKGNWIEKKHIFLPPEEFITRKSRHPKLITKRKIEYYEE